MIYVARFLRSWFGVEALMLSAGSAYAVYRLGVGFHAGLLPLHLEQVVRIMLIAMPAAAIVTGNAWWKLRQGKQSGWLWALAASLMNLPLFGLGTLIGIAGLAPLFVAGILVGVLGLVVFARTDIVDRLSADIAKEQAATHIRIESDATKLDGTKKWLEAAAVVGQVVFFLAGNAFRITGRNAPRSPSRNRSLGSSSASSRF